MAHTEGPWKLDQEELFIFGPNTEMIAEIRGYGAGLPQYANGNLIAAAPDMLEALEQAYDYLNGVEAEPMASHVLKAINKAKGIS